MYRIMCAIVVGLAAAPSLAQQSNAGNVNLAGIHNEAVGQSLPYLGALRDSTGPIERPTELLNNRNTTMRLSQAGGSAGAGEGGSAGAGEGGSAGAGGGGKAGSGGATREFGGLQFGVGISLTHDLGGHDRVVSASVVNGIVRVTEERNDIARIMLESHYFFTYTKNPNRIWGHGPFIAIQPGSNEIVESIAFGWMFGIKRAEGGADTSSWNIGFGAVVDPSVQVLGDGIEKNQPLPPGETEVRYKKESQWGVLIISSFTF